jgi:hypothetical protein
MTDKFQKKCNRKEATAFGHRGLSASITATARGARYQAESSEYLAVAAQNV